MIQVPGYLAVGSHIYNSQDQYDREMKAVFKNSWQLIAVVPEIKDEGAYIARDVLGVPVIIWNIGGTFKAYINVCPHRNSMIVDPDTTGNKEILKCPYHGWEFNGQGKVCKIPEAQCFKGLKKQGEHHLHSAPLEQLGDYLFVCIDSQETRSLQNYMGSRIYGSLQEMSNTYPHFMFFRESILECNWKAMFETNIEDYHTPYVHSNSLGKGVEWDDMSLFYERAENGAGSISSVGGSGVEGRCDLGAPVVTLSLFSGFHITTVRISDTPGMVVEQTSPITPTTCRRRVWVMSFDGVNTETLLATESSVMKVLLEDEELLLRLQKGKTNSISNQLVGKYEQRIAFLYEYLTNQCEE